MYPGLHALIPSLLSRAFKELARYFLAQMALGRHKTPGCSVVKQT